MIVILRPGAQKARVEALMSQIKQQGVDIHYSQGATETILGLVGDTTHVDEDWLRASDIVEDVRRVVLVEHVAAQARVEHPEKRGLREKVP